MVRLQSPSKQLNSLFVFSFILFIIPNKRKQWLKPLHKETKLKAENIAIVIMIMMIRIIAIIATVWIDSIYLKSNKTEKSFNN